MANKRQIGSQGEDLAGWYLKTQGYRVVGKNLKSRYGEVDVVAQKGNRIYFVEIRFRTSPGYGRALESITEEKKRRLRQTAQVLLTKNKTWGTLIPFFSVLAIDEDMNGNVQIEFLPDAFD